MAKAEVLRSESDTQLRVFRNVEQGTCQDWWRQVYREAESMNDWFKGTYCARAYRVEWGGNIVDSAPAFCERPGSTSAYMRVVSFGEGGLK